MENIKIEKIIETINSLNNIEDLKKFNSKDFLTIYFDNKEKAVNKINEIIMQDINKIKNIKNIYIENTFDLEEYYNQQLMTDNYEEYVKVEPPSFENICKELNVKKKNIVLEYLFKSKKEERIAKEEEAKQKFNEEMENYNIREKNNYEEYENNRKKYENSIKEFNETILRKKIDFLEGEEKEFIACFKEYFIKALKPIVIGDRFQGQIAYEPTIKTCVITYNFLDFLNFNYDIKSCKYIKSKDNISIQKFSNSEKKELYEEYIYQTTLKTIDIVSKFNTENIEQIIFNGIVNTINLSNGINENFNILSVKVNRNEFKEINLEFVNSKQCLISMGMRHIKDLSRAKNIVPFDIIKNMEKTIDNIDENIDGFEFENMSKKLLEANGFENVTVTQCSSDYGADVIATKNDIKYAIQCKKYSQAVGVKAVQEVMGSKSIYNCHVAVVLTNNFFTSNAEKLAQKNNVLLWDRTKLQELLENYKNQ